MKKTYMRSDHLLDFYFSPSSGALKQPSFLVDDVHALQVESQADETPFACCGCQSAQGKLSKAEDLFEDADNRFHSGFSQPIDRLPNLGLEFVGHLEDGTGIVRGGSGCCWKKVFQSR